MRSSSVPACFVATAIACGSSGSASSSNQDGGVDAGTDSGAVDSGASGSVSVVGTDAMLRDAFSVKTANGKTQIVLSSAIGGCEARKAHKALPNQTSVIVFLDGTTPGHYPIAQTPLDGGAPSAAVVLQVVGEACTEVEHGSAATGGVVIDRIDAQGVHGTLEVEPLSPSTPVGLQGEFDAPTCPAIDDGAPLGCAD